MKTTPQTITDKITDQLSIEMVKVPGGTFMMGSNKKEREQPIREVQISDFYLGRYLITNEQFLPFLLDLGNKKAGNKEWINLNGESVGIEEYQNLYRCVLGLKNHPLVYINWFGAKAYCKWLSEKTGLFYRLPSEAEWEYVAKGGQYDQGFTYVGSNKLEEVGWFGENSHDEIKPVGLKMGNELGLYDLNGNVWEWCADHWHNNYEGAPSNGKNWNKSGDERRRVVRGGAKNSHPRSCLLSYRYDRDGYGRHINVGLRVARS